MIVPLLITLMITIVAIQILNEKNKGGQVVPPGPPRLPLIGNLLQFTAKNQHVHLWKLSQKYGPIIHMKVGPVNILVISCAKLARQVFEAQDSSFCTRPNQLGQQKLSYNGSEIVYSPPHHRWREMKKLITLNLFSPGKIQSFRPVREDEISRMVSQIKKCSSSAVNLNEIATGLITSLVCRTAFGKSGFEKRRFDELLKETRAMLACFFVSDYYPSFSWVDKVLGLIDRLDATFNDLDSFYEELIDHHLRVKEKGEEEEDILDILIKLEEQDHNWNHVKAMLTDIFVAGTDSTAATIVWSMTALMKSPNVMKKVQAEIRNLVGKRGKVDEDELPKLPYLKAIIKETFRLYPPIPFLTRETRERCILDGYEILPKTVVRINAWAIARDPEYWENPDEFIPERFLNCDIDIRGKDFRVMPFGSGRRMCPGVPMGLANVELALANLLYSFDWELPPGIHPNHIDTDVLPGLIMHKKNALLIIPKKYHL